MLKLVLEYFAKFFVDEKVKDTLVKLGINFITAGMVGVFVNHIAGYDVNTMQLSAGLISYYGLALLILGLRK